MYPPGFDTHVEPGALAEPMEGAMRPGHFRGVTTVVAKLFAAVRPHVALFGQKDYQQLAIIRRMASDLDTGVEIVSVPTVREADGLALSSRNVRLSPEDRAAAVVVPRALAAVVDAHAAGVTESAQLIAIAHQILDAEPRARTEYVQVADALSLAPLLTVNRPAVVAAAVWFVDVRLIDNALIGP
jgi:pantoate--beta-alanine ligase